MTALSVQDVAFVQAMAEREAGLNLYDFRPGFVSERLAGVASTKGFSDAAALVRALKNNQEGLIQAVLDGLLVNITSFFRNPASFVLLRDHVLPDLLLKNRESREMRIWSAACSTGQEAYSLAMLMPQCRALLNGWKVSVFGSDISTAHIAQAQAGVYSHKEVARADEVLDAANYFHRKGEAWRVNDAVRSLTEFQPLNLFQLPASPQRFHVIFLRNVLIYFSRANAVRLLQGIRDCLMPGGYLFTGFYEHADHLDPGGWLPVVRCGACAYQRL